MIHNPPSGPGAVHDLKAARIWGLTRALAEALTRLGASTNALMPIRQKRCHGP
ncbi:hypothetical protein GCM10023195_05000 [Actinoallomurus liliacearum]|uniref:Uncharacterized protein n=1 Tax=Actinoallomurus liliacearum TaxID=1080073 RepID=A0ABP8T9N2_9ACTN